MARSRNHFAVDATVQCIMCLLQSHITLSAVLHNNAVVVNLYQRQQCKLHVPVLREIICAVSSSVSHVTYKRCVETKQRSCGRGILQSYSLAQEIINMLLRNFSVLVRCCSKSLYKIRRNHHL